MKVGSTIFVGRTGADLAGFRSLEDRFDALLADCVFGVERVSRSTMGIDFGYFRRNFKTANLVEVVPMLTQLIAKQRESYDANGWIVEKSNKVGTPGDYMNGDDLDIVSCPNEISKKRFSKLVDEDEGEWIGLEFHLKSSGPCDIDFESILQAWIAEEPSDEIDINNREEVQQIVEPEEETTQADQANATRVLKEFGTNFNILDTSARLKLFWGGGKAPSSRRAAEALAVKSFPEEEVEYPAVIFVKIVKDRLVDNWGFEQYKTEMGDVDLDQLVVGQILQKKGQIQVNYGKKTLMYVPKPAAYKASQMRVKGAE